METSPVDRRVLKDEIFLRMSKVASELSTCPRNKFASILVNEDGRIKGHGYNGTPTGTSNLCGGKDCLRDRLNIKSGTDLAVGCIHDSTNLLLNCERKDFIGGTVYCNGEPCSRCALYLIQSGISRVVCYEGGYSTKEGVDILREYGVIVDLVTE